MNIFNSSRPRRVSTAIIAATVWMAACGGQSTSSASQRARFCELARERDKQQPEINFEKASADEVKAALGPYVERVHDNVEESKRLAPDPIRADFEKSVTDTRRAAETGDLSEFEKPEMQRVGEYLQKTCGIK